MQELGSGQNPGPGHENCPETAEMIMVMRMMPSIMMMITWRTLD